MIVFVDQSGQVGGAELCLAEIAHHYRAEGRVVLFSEGPFADLLQEREVNTSVVPLPKTLAAATKRSSIFSMAGKLPALASHILALRKEFSDGEVLYFNTAKALLHGVVANLGRGRPSLFHLHDLWVAHHFSAVNIRLLVAAANQTRAVIANSQASADAFLAAGGRVPTYVVPNGFDPAPFDAVTRGETEALQEAYNPEGRLVVAIFGRLSRWKGQEALIRAASCLPQVTVWIVGVALFTADDRAYAEELQRMAASLGDRVRFLGFRRDVAALMRAADIIVHASVAPEPFGRVLVEGMLAGKPVIATHGGGPEEIVEEGATGLLLPAGDDAALARAIGRLADAPELREAMGRKGRARAERLYALPATLVKINEVIETLL